MIGRRLGVYELQALVGRGGMGEVYRARDTRLGRDVAIKILPPAFTSDPDRLARFEREARVLASLNHPNIATIHGVEDTDGIFGLVMELIPGPTLAESLLSGPLPVSEALPIARQIADALAAAHESGIVHRDLKPANVKVNGGHVKLLDFGLAKLTADERRAEAVNMPTVTLGQTGEGQVMGTVAYMSPEQARGKTVDKRTDIWAFGCVLYEMLTGHPAFHGETASDRIAAVLDRAPDWSALPANTPPLVRRLVTRCLQKDPARRLRDIADAQPDLDEQAAGSSVAAGLAPVPRGFPIRAVAGLAIAVGLLGGLAGWAFRRGPASRSQEHSVRLTMQFADHPRVQPYGVANLAISHDGLRVAYASNTRLWMRRMDQKDPIAIGSLSMDPFFSPDGAWVAVFDSTGLIKVPVDGGPPAQIAATTDRPAGGAWRSDGEIVFATNAGLFRVSSDGQDLRLVAAPDRDKRERLYAWPEFLPGGRSILFTVVSTDSADEAVLAAMDLETLERKIVLRGASSARYAPPGRLIYETRTGLKAIAFDPGRVETSGDAVDVQGTDVSVAPDNAAADFAVSETGTLVYMSGEGNDLRILQWVDRQGNRERINVAPGIYSYPRVSPDGTRVALDIVGRNRDIWVLNLERLTLTQLTNGPTEDMTPEWSVDGTRVFFASDRTGDFDVYSQAADGASSPRVELAAPGFQTPQGFTPDGSQLVIYEQFKDLSVFSIGPTPNVERLLHGDAEHRLGRISPDGRWMMYESDESGKQFEVFIRPFPNVGATREKVSLNGGRFPRWSPKGSELYYLTLDGDMMAVPVTLSPSLKLGRPIKLFTWRKPQLERGSLPYDVSPIDGRFIVTEPQDSEQSGPIAVSVVQNWMSLP